MLVATFVAPVAHPAAASDARALYRAALTAMSELREPPFLTYRTTVSGNDGTLLVSRGDRGEAELGVVAGTSPVQSWNVAYRSSDGIASIAMPGGGHVVSSLAVFDPTWRGAFVWLRHGLDASLDAATPSPLPPAESPSASPDVSVPPTIGTVTAINENAYDISDAGAARCPDGRDARRLRMRAKTEPLEHPLTQATVDVQTHRFCAMRFTQHLASPTVTFDVDVELQFGAVETYYLITGGSIDGAVRPFQRPGWFAIHTRFRHDAFAFPAALPNARFVPSG